MKTGRLANCKNVIDIIFDIPDHTSPAEKYNTNIFRIDRIQKKKLDKYLKFYKKILFHHRFLQFFSEYGTAKTCEKKNN